MNIPRLRDENMPFINIKQVAPADDEPSFTDKLKESTGPTPKKKKEKTLFSQVERPKRNQQRVDYKLKSEGETLPGQKSNNKRSAEIKMEDPQKRRRTEILNVNTRGVEMHQAKSSNKTQINYIALFYGANANNNNNNQ